MPEKLQTLEKGLRAVTDLLKEAFARSPDASPWGGL
jgi:hypothetical protein